MLENYFIHGCTIYRQIVNEYNDILNTESHLESCHFRDNTAISSGNVGLNREEETSDAMAWFPAGEAVNKGDIVVVDGMAYRIERIVHARRLGQMEVQFIKCWLERFEAFVS